MITAEEQRAYRIEDLSHLSGTTVRTIRAYTDRGLLPKPARRGRANVYDDGHLARLRQIADLLERGYTLASIKELLAAWDAGTGLGGVLGLVGEVDRPWTDEAPARIALTELTESFGGSVDLSAVEEALRLGILEAVPGREDEFLAPSPSELAVAVELHRAGVPLAAITGHLRELRGEVEHISERFLEFSTEYVFQRFLQHPPTEEEAAEATDLIRRLRPLAQQTVDAELARAMRLRATEHIRRHLGDAVLGPTAEMGLSAGAEGAAGSQGAAASAGVGVPTGSDGAAGSAELIGAAELLGTVEPEERLVRSAGLTGSAGPAEAVGRGEPADSGTAAAPDPSGAVALPSELATVPVVLPGTTVAAVRELVGSERVPAFVAAAADREVAARRMDALAGRPTPEQGPATP